MNDRIKLKRQGRGTEKEEHIRLVIEEYWSKITKTDNAEERTNNAVIYSDRRVMESAVIEMREIERVLKALKNGKAVGTDEIIGEFLKHGGDTARKVVYNLCTKILEEGAVPQD